jgi:RNA polymerase sigma factor (sigma-70 family)
MPATNHCAFTAATSRAAASKEATSLVAACLRGDQRAWDRLVDAYGRLVYTICHRCGLRAEDADDVFQEVFTLLFRCLPTLRDDAKLGAWIATITARECWRRCRAASAAAARVEPAAEDHSAIRRERADAVHEAVNHLPERERHLVLALFADTSPGTYTAAAARARMPTGSIGPTRARCLNHLEERLGGHW